MSEMTSRERWLALLDNKTPDRIPTDIWCTDEVRDRLIREVGQGDFESVLQRLHIDRPFHIEAPFGVPARCRLPHHPNDPQANIWGIRFKPIDYGTGVYDEAAFNPLATANSVADIEKFRWPSADDFDLGSLESEFSKVDGRRIVQAGCYEPFLLACWMRGMEQAFMDLLVEPEIIEAVLAHIFEFHYEFNRKLFEAGRGRIDLFYLAEDLGSQNGPLLSVEAYRKFLKPNQIRMAELARKHNIRIIYHTDGAARPFLADLVNDVGIDILNPIQWRCPGMERDSLVKEFGSRVIFHGAMDNQHTLPFGTPRDVADEVKQNIELFSNARWICAPCHRIQPNTPTANIVALYETIRQFGGI